MFYYTKWSIIFKFDSSWHINCLSLISFLRKKIGLIRSHWKIEWRQLLQLYFAKNANTTLNVSCEKALAELFEKFNLIVKNDLARLVTRIPLASTTPLTKKGIILKLKCSQQIYNRIDLEACIKCMHYTFYFE